MNSKIRNIYSESRVFQNKWFNQYFVIKVKSRFLFVVNLFVSVMKECNIKRYYESKRKVKYYDALLEQLRKIEVQKLQKVLTGKQSIFSKVTVQNK